MGLADQRHALSGYRRALAGALLASASLASCAGDSRPDQDTLRTEAFANFAGLLSVEDQVELDRQRARIVEDAIAECMRERGFQYEAFYDSYRLNGAAHGMSTDFTSLEFAQSHGFGVVALDGIPTVELPTDPNTTYWLQQEVSLQQSWSVALDGPAAEGSQTCRSIGEDAFTSTVGIDYDNLTELYIQTEASVEMAQPTSDWRSCAEQAGFLATSRRSLIDQFRDRRQAITGDGPSNDVPDGALDGLAREEIAAAVATFDCSQAYDTAFKAAFLAAAQAE